MYHRLNLNERKGENELKKKIIIIIKKKKKKHQLTYKMDQILA